MATWNLINADDPVLARDAIGIVPNSDLYTTFVGKADGAIPTVGDENIAVTHRGGYLNNLRLTVADNLMQTPDLSGVAGDRGAYWNQPLVGGKRIGASFKFDAGVDPVTSATLVLWEYAIPTPYKVPNSPMHLSITPTTWGLTVWEGGDSGTDATSTTLASGTFGTALATDWDPATAGSGTLHRAEVLIVGSTCYIALPSGQTVKVDDSRFASIPVAVACHELYRNATNSGYAAFEDIWAGTAEGPMGAASLGEAARLANSAMPAPRFGRYTGAAADISPVPTSTTAVTGLPTITLTTPPAHIDGGGVVDMEVQANLYYVVTGASQILVSVLVGATTYATGYVLDSAAFKGRVTYVGHVMSLLPETEYTFTLRHRVISGTGAVLKMDGPSGYPVSWKVTPMVESA